MRILLALAASAYCWAQAPPTALLSAAAANQLCQRSIQLMESGGVAMPDLRRAAGPVIENTRQACGQLQLRAGAGQPTFDFMTNLRAYLDLADAVPKPFPFPEAARAQLAELRDGYTRLSAHFRALLLSKDAQLRAPDRDNLARYAEANGKLGAPAAGGRVVFFGDSITDLWRLNEYFPDRDFVNRGISGQVTDEMLARMKADVLDLKPQAVLILAGTNDLARAVPLKTIEDSLTTMAELAAAHNIKVIFASLLPVNDYHKATNPAQDQVSARPPEYILGLNEWLTTYTAQHHLIYVNYFDALVDDRGLLNNDYSDDGLHPNAKGYRLMAPLALEAISKTLKPPPPPVTEAKPSKRR